MMKARLEALMSQPSEEHFFLEDLSDDEAEMVAGGRMTSYANSQNSGYILCTRIFLRVKKHWS
jgi:hypothetical protein